ncbi:hypothetical protein FZEAL_9542 [Fusarium zealandicum]|uniref:Glutamine synthetase n=1 Tax=Fusarium zealandicum TaxID=1053134 RepID=A0A8H4UAT2_9HYPO|nr:hypothetical protein FZEAL_9542 [Fusarium zealandicum]
MNQKLTPTTAALVACPLGVLADRIGCIPVLGLSILSMLLSQAYAMIICWQWKEIPIEAIWGLGVPLLIGGGRSVAEAMVFAIIADAVPDKRRQVAATWFQWVVAAVLSGQLLGPILAGIMKTMVWMSLWISMGLVFVGGLVLVAFTPETSRQRQHDDAISLSSALPGPAEQMSSSRATAKLVFSRPMIWLFPGAVMSIPLATIQSGILIQFMPIQFDWPLSHSILVISLQSLAALVTLCLLLPSITYFWAKLTATTSPHYRDCVLARGSSLLFLAGCMCMMMVTDQVLIIVGLTISATAPPTYLVSSHHPLRLMLNSRSHGSRSKHHSKGSLSAEQTKMAVDQVNTEEALRRLIHTTPIIDHHAHPLLKLNAIRKHSLLSIATEAEGDALDDSKTGLAHIRTVNILSALLGTEPTWEAVEAAIARKQAGNYQEWTQRCLSGIETILVDDGLGNSADAEPYNKFDAFTRSPNKRILRIEEVAAECIEKACVQFSHPSEAFSGAVENFMDAIYDALDDPAVVGFKSVICYRTGLAVAQITDLEALMQRFQIIFEARKEDGAEPFTRLNHEPLNDYFVHILAGLIQNSEDAHKKPIQFHTGLGDNDITLNKSSPSHLQDFIKTYPEVPIVLLHASYPFTRELGYLATVYSNVYADIGEVFPFLSRDGQEGVIRQILELCPVSKILWSTDGHWFPETYVVAVDQLRQVLHSVLVDCVYKGDLTWKQSAQLVQDVLFHNANKLYDLRLEFKPLPPDSGLGYEASEYKSLATLSQFLKNKEEPRFLRVYWNDFTAMPRMRAVPMRRVWSLLRSGGDFSFGVTKAGLGILQNDVPVSDISPSGEYRMHPDLSTLRPGPRKGHITVMGDFKEKDGSAVSLCPRSFLKGALSKAAEQGLTFNFGFEIELVLFRRGDGDKYEALDGDGHAWSVGRAMEHEASVEVLEDAIEQLDEAGVYIEMVHPESANGQYEIVLPHAPALEAVDTLLYARDVISSCATAKGLRMTLHPKPYAIACGTAAHVHMSISSPNGPSEEVYEPFYAGILKHLRAITAFTYSNMVSYERALDGCWAGGTWVAWGTQNREVPLRKIEGSHWELKCIDGLANPYLALSAVLLAGTKGVADKQELFWGDCTEDPSQLSLADRDRLNIRDRLPMSIKESLRSLTMDAEMVELLGSALVRRYSNIKMAETDMLEKMGDEERRRWIMERY